MRTSNHRQRRGHNGPLLQFCIRKHPQPVWRWSAFDVLTCFGPPSPKSEEIADATPNAAQDATCPMSRMPVQVKKTLTVRWPHYALQGKLGGDRHDIQIAASCCKNLPKTLDVILAPT